MDDATFFAWLDGELEPAEAKAVAARVAADPQLTRRAEEHRALAERLRGAFEPVAGQAVPPAILAAASPRAEVVDLAEARERRRAWAIPAGAQWAAMAATLAIGIVTGTLIGSDRSAPAGRGTVQVAAGGELERALDVRLASAPAAAGPRIGLTFRDSAGAICRTFEDESSSGLACREGEDWEIRGLFQNDNEGGGDYRMASGPDPRLAELVDATIADEPFDAEAERAAQARGWR